MLKTVTAHKRQALDSARTTFTGTASLTDYRAIAVWLTLSLQEWYPGSTGILSGWLSLQSVCLCMM